MINAGFDNFINQNKIINISDCSERFTCPAKRDIAKARTVGTLIDITRGRKAKSVIYMDGGFIILSHVLVSTLKKKIKSKEANQC